MNRVYVRTTKSFEFPQRHRSGLTFTKVPEQYELTDEQLEAVKNDNFLEIIDDKKYEYEINMIKGYKPSLKAVETESLKAVESQATKMIEEAKEIKEEANNKPQEEPKENESNDEAKKEEHKKENKPRNKPSKSKPKK